LRPTSTVTVDRPKIEGYQGSRKTILVVDDKRENQALLHSALAPLGFEMIKAWDGEEGLQKAQQYQPDLIVTDLVMPRQSGIELIQSLRRLPAFTAVPIIASSASVFEKDQTQSLAAGANGFLAKPIQLDQLFAFLQQHLSLTWIYSETTSDPSPPAPESALESALILPPPDLLCSLLDLVDQGNLEGLIAQARSLQQAHEQYGPFSDRLIQLAEAFHINALKALLQDSLNL
jgi:CheY-like chemotaxis protein